MCVTVLSGTLIFHCTVRQRRIEFRSARWLYFIRKGRSDIKLNCSEENLFSTVHDYVLFCCNRGYARERGSSHTLETMIDEPTVHADPQQRNNAPNQLNKPRGYNSLHYNLHEYFL